MKVFPIRVLAACLAILVTIGAAAAQSDPPPSWNDTPTR